MVVMMWDSGGWIDDGDALRLGILGGFVPRNLPTGVEISEWVEIYRLG